MELPFANKVTQASPMGKKDKDIVGNFGDGYQQVAGRGIKPSRDSWSLELKPLTYNEKRVFESFLNIVGSWGIVTWTPSWHPSPKAFKITGTPEIQQLSFTMFSVKLVLEEV